MIDKLDPSVDALHCSPVYLVYGRKHILVDVLTAQALLAVYNQLPNPKKVKFIKMMKTHDGLMRLIGYAWEQVEATKKS